LVGEIMPGEDLEAAKATIEKLGGNVVQVNDVSGTQWVSFDLRNNRLHQLAKDPAFIGIFEKREYTRMNLTTSAQVEMGRFLDPRDFGKFVLPLRDAGVDGGGVVTGQPNYSDPNPGSALSLAGATFAVPQQILGLADNGLTLDSPMFANDNTHPCLTGTCSDSGTAAGLSGLGP